MSDREHAYMLLGLARRDLTALGGMLDVNTFADEIFGFHAQQAVEKALKAWLSLIEIEYPSIHAHLLPIPHESAAHSRGYEHAPSIVGQQGRVRQARVMPAPPTMP